EREVRATLADEPGDREVKALADELGPQIARTPGTTAWSDAAGRPTAESETPKSAPQVTAAQRRDIDDDLLLAILCRRTLDGGARGGSTERPAHQIAISTCRACKQAWQIGAGRELPIDAAVLARAACDAELLGDVEADPPGRVSSTISARKRRQIFA